MSLTAPFRRTGFAGLLIGQVVSITGDRFNYLALIALITAHAAARGQNPAPLLAALAWAMLGPALVCSPWAGAVVDRLPLTRVLVWTDLARAAVVALIPVAYLATHSTVPVFALVALAFALNAFFLPARSALPPQLVSGAELQPANAILVLGGVLATLVGTALGGPVVDRFGPSPALWIDAATYLVSVLALATLLRAGIGARRAPSDRGRAGWGTALSEARAGWSILASNAGARTPVVASVATWIAGGVLHVAGTPHVLRGSTHVTGLGLLLGALAVGAALGSAVTLARPRVGHARALAIGLFGAGIGLAGFALATAPWAMTLAAAWTGFFAAPVFFVSETAIQEAVPEAARARVFSARDFLSKGSFLAVTALAAPLVARFGTAVPIGLAGGVLMMIALIVLAARPRAADASQLSSRGETPCSEDA